MEYFLKVLEDKVFAIFSFIISNIARISKEILNNKKNKREYSLRAIATINSLLNELEICLHIIEEKINRQLPETKWHGTDILPIEVILILKNAKESKINPIEFINRCENYFENIDKWGTNKKGYKEETEFLIETFKQYKSTLEKFSK
jgi:hypothetical protein